MASFYLSSTLLWGSSPEEMFQLAYQSGLSGIELWAQHFFYQKYNTEEYRKLSALYPLRGCVHSQSWDLNLASLNDGIRTQSIAEVKKSIDLARCLDLEEVTVHPGHRTIPGAGEPYRKYLRESLKEILEYAEKLGIDISLEIMEKLPKEFATSMEAMEQICGPLFDRFVYTLDIAHCDSSQEALNTLKTYGHRISKIHISNRRGNQFHTPLYEGDYDMVQLLPELARYDLPMVIEGFDSQGSFDIAKQNIHFIQTIFQNGGKKQ